MKHVESGSFGRGIAAVNCKPMIRQLLVLLSFVLVLLPGVQVSAQERGRPRIVVTSVFVDNQEKALRFYTEVLGFVKKQDFPVGTFRWLTVVSPESPDGVELLLEPNENPATRVFQKATFEQGIPFTTFGVANLEQEHERLKKLNVVFRTPPTRRGPVSVAVIDDTCGNLIQLAQR